MAATNEMRFVLRLPEPLHAELTQQAKREQRSLNSQILHILMNHVALNTRTIPLDDLITMLSESLAVSDGSD